MRTTITARHIEIPASLRTRTEQVMARLGHLSPHALESTVVFDEDGGACTAEVRLHVRRWQILVGHGDGADHRAALDRAEDKVRRQLERNGTVRRPRRPPAPRP
jgi:ribosomal subunit interface protein